MYCNNCGKFIDEGAAFCTNCGKRMEAAPPVTISQQEAVSAEASAVTEPAPAAEQTNASYINYNPYNSNSGIYEKTEPADPPVNEFLRAQEPPEKVDFGKGALAFCLVIIGLLAISTGVFAGLYFSLI
ncbi:MAG: zinc ribbon domain-containing protein [Ruminiclostridium sp.]|nr:zinc ribbon domain-containing protein [Ruminiclostridium sp.]